MVRGTSALGGCHHRRPESRPVRGHVSYWRARAMSHGGATMESTLNRFKQPAAGQEKKPETMSG